MSEFTKPVIGISCGDINGIGLEIIIKSVADGRLLELCTPVIFASNKCVNFYRKSMPENNLQYQAIKDFTRLNTKMINVFNCWEEDVVITPGELNETGGQYALKSLVAATEALKTGNIHALVTAPIHKKNIQSEAFNFSGHTPYLKHAFNVPDVVMMLVADNMRVALVTEHLPVKNMASEITKQSILQKLEIINKSLQKDFGIDKPKIAVLGLNPHAGDEGLIGEEEIAIIKPAINEAKNKGIMAFGPYSADAFFARASYNHFDAVLAMYHDQGLIPFKSLSFGEGVNYTAGLPVVRTSPDHGTAFDIAGKGEADHTSLLAAIFKAIDLLDQQNFYKNNRENPLKKMSEKVVANIDEAPPVSLSDEV